MVSPYVKAELTAAVSSLGYAEGGKYFKDQYCLEALKDVIRYLRRDNDNLDIRRELGQMKIVQTSLIPILCEYFKDEALFDVTLRLMVNLTNPTLLLFNEELPQEKVARNYYMQHVGHLQSYKPAFILEKFWIVLTDKLKLLLVKDADERLEDDRLIIERILILIRNILDIPPNPDDEKRTDDDASIHDQVLWSMHLSGMEDVIIYLASNENERHFCMHVMEIISLMLREQDPAILARAAAQRSVAEQQKDSDDLAAILRRENAEKEAKMKKMISSRSSIFRGTFCVKDVKSISDREMIVHRQVADVSQLDFSKDKKAKRKPKNRLPLADSDGTRRSTLAIRLMLKEFCLQLLNGAYNSLMRIVKDCLVRMRAQDHDESYYLWAVKFFMEFNRNGKFRVELVSETMSVALFHYIQGLIENYSETLRLDKKKCALWSRRLHLALRAYQELLMTLGAMDKYSTEAVKKSARVIKSNVFYVLEYREMCLVLLQNYNEAQHSLSYLKDLVETTHIFLKLLEQFCKVNRHVVVQRKVRSKSKSKKKKKSASKDDKSLGDSTANKCVNFDEISGEVSTLLQENGDIPSDVVPFDAASDVPIDEQKTEAMKKIKKCLKEFNAQGAIAMLRASREVWPEGEVFGSPEVRPEEELLILREIFLADLPMDDDADGSGEPDEDGGDEEGESEGEEVEKEEMASVKIGEQELTFQEFIHRFAHNKIVHAYCFLLNHYATNSSLTNHCIVKMLHRIAFDSKMPAMLFQASAFKAFQTILDDPKSKVDPSIKELAKFGIYIVRKFAQVSLDNPKVFAELLFWKTARDAAEIELGYGNYKEPNSESRSAWTEEEEDELQRLYEEFKNVQDPERSVVDLVMTNLINQNRSRRIVIKKMKDLGLITAAKDISRPKKSINIRPPKEWANHEEVELRRIFEEVRDSSDPLGLLVDRLPIRRGKHRIKAKILELGLVSDAKELRKKRTKKSGKHSSGKSASHAHGDNSGDEDDGREDDDDDDESESDASLSDDDNPEPSGYRRSKKRKQYAFLRLDSQPFNPETMTTVFDQLIENGGREGLQWLVECLQEAHEDRVADEDSVESVPLLPLSVAATAAMDDHRFLNFIGKLGLAPPSSEQEQYWRIPSTLSTQAMQQRINYLEAALKGELIGPTSPEPARKATPKVKSGKRDSNSIDEPDELPVASSKRRRIIADDSSDEEDRPAGKEDPSLTLEEPASPEEASGAASRKSRLVLFDSDSD